VSNLQERINRLAFASDSTTVELNEAHPNSKIYDDCQDGYKKVPGKARGEKGSCIDETDELTDLYKENSMIGDENFSYAMAKKVIEDPDADEVEIDGKKFPVKMSKKKAEEIAGDESDQKTDEAIEEAIFYWKLETITEAPKKYDHIDFKPPAGVAKAAERGLELRKKAGGKGGLNQKQAKKAGVGSGVSRAATLKNRKNVSPSTVKRMKSFFARHEKNKDIAKGKSAHEDKGYVAWQLWGGNAGQSWANKVTRQMDAADKKAKKK